MILIDSVTKDLKPWVEAFNAQLPGQITTFEHCRDLKAVNAAIVWNHRPELFDLIPNVKMICSLGAGVDHILKDPKLPGHVPITRVVSDELSMPMSNFCIGAIVYFQRKFDKYTRDKLTKTWDQEFNPERSMDVGILGLGELGQDLAKKLVMLGFNVSGLSRTRKGLPGVKSFVEAELEAFLKAIHTLVVMLPATRGNKGILNKIFFKKMQEGSFLINVARGHHQVDEDIIWALDEGILEGAFLDVFPREPLPKDSPLWTHPKVFITPHLAVVTKLEAAVPAIVENYQRLLKGLPLLNVIDRKKGY